MKTTRKHSTTPQVPTNQVNLEAKKRIFQLLKNFQIVLYIYFCSSFCYFTIDMDKKNDRDPDPTFPFEYVGSGSHFLTDWIWIKIVFSFDRNFCYNLRSPRFYHLKITLLSLSSYLCQSLSLSLFLSHLYLIKRMTPKMFCMQGRKTPIMVPRLA